MSYLDQCTQADWDKFNQNLCNIFGVDYEPTVYNPLHLDSTKYYAPWEGNKHSEESKQKMKKSWTSEKRKNKSLSQKEYFNNPINIKKIRDKINNPEIKEKWRNDRLRSYEITDPNGKTFIVRGLTRFCEENGLSLHKMLNVAKGTLNHHKQYTCQKL